MQRKVIVEATSGAASQSYGFLQVSMSSGADLANFAAGLVTVMTGEVMEGWGDLPCVPIIHRGDRADLFYQ